MFCQAGTGENTRLYVRGAMCSGQLSPLPPPPEIAAAPSPPCALFVQDGRLPGQYLFPFFFSEELSV